MKLTINKRGETLVEVVLGLAILTAVLVGAYILSTQATRITQEANERTEVSNFMRQQVEILKASKLQFERTGDSNLWTAIAGTSYLASGSNYSGGCKDTPNPDNTEDIATPSGIGVVPFFINLSDPSVVEINDAFDGGVQSGNYFADGKYTIWMEAYSEPGSEEIDTPYIDVFVTACWERLGGANIESSGMIVRLNQWQ